MLKKGKIQRLATALGGRPVAQITQFSKIILKRFIFFILLRDFWDFWDFPATGFLALFPFLWL
jgi:hypothetical protein